MREEEKATPSKYSSAYFILGMTVLFGNFIYLTRISVRINICFEVNSGFNPHKSWKNEVSFILRLKTSHTLFLIYVHEKPGLGVNSHRRVMENIFKIIESNG